MHVFICALFSHGYWRVCVCVCVNGDGTCTAVGTPPLTTSVPITQLFNSVRHNHTMLHIAQRGNLIHSCCADLLFGCIKAATGYHFQTRLSTQRFNANPQYSPVHTHPTDGNIYKYKPHGFRLYNPLPALPYFWPEVHNYESMHNDPTQWTICQVTSGHNKDPSLQILLPSRRTDFANFFLEQFLTKNPPKKHY